MRNDSEDTIIHIPSLADNLNIRKFLIIRNNFSKIIFAPKDQRKQQAENNPENDNFYDKDDFPDEYDSEELEGLGSRSDHMKVVH